MAEIERAQLVVSGVTPDSGPVLARLEIEGSRLEIAVREYTDPALRSGRGGNPGVIAALGSIADRSGGTWVIAAVERGRPRLINPESLGVISLLGRRREWRGCAEHREPFLSVICDRAPVEVSGDHFAITRSPGRGVDLLRVRPGEAIERWSLGEFPTRVELHGRERLLALIARDRIATIEVDELVPGGCPLTDPREVELALQFHTLPSTAVALCDLPAGAKRALECEAGDWTISEFELSGDSLQRRASWAIEPPTRWLSGPGDSLWIASDRGWTRVEAGQGPQERSDDPRAGVGPATIQIDEAGHPWLWTWRTDRGELHKLDAMALARGPVGCWTISSDFRAQQLIVVERTEAPNRELVVHPDQLAELLALEPGLMADWPRWFERASARSNPSAGRLD